MQAPKLILSLSMAVIASAAAAQAQSPATGESRPAAPRGERPSPEKMRQMFEERFRKADADGDGALSKAEAEKAMPMLARDFEKVDSNEDGKITPEEIRAAMDKRRAEMKDRMKDQGGKPRDPGGRGPMSAEERQKRGDAMFKRADVNGDGFLTEDEASKAAPFLAKNFAAIDANKDGKLSREEIQAYGEARRKEYEAKRGPGKGESAPK